MYVKLRFNIWIVDNDLEFREQVLHDAKDVEQSYAVNDAYSSSKAATAAKEALQVAQAHAEELASFCWNTETVHQGKSSHPQTLEYIEYQ